MKHYSTLTRNTFPGLALAFALLACLLTGCAKSESPSLSDLPADAEYVVMLNLDSIGQEGNLQQGISMLIPGDLNGLPDNAAQCLDLSNVMAYKPTETKMAIVAVGITDEDMLTEALVKAGWTKRKVNGEEIYEPDGSGEFGRCIVIDRGAAWYLTTRNDLKNWRESLRRASDNNFSQYPTADVIASRGVLTAFINPSAVGLPGSDKLFTVTTARASGSITFTGRLIATDEAHRGEEVPLDLLSDLGSAPAALSPMLCAGPTLTIMAGMTQAIDWGNMVEMAGADLGTQNQGMLQSLLPYIRSLNGIMAINVGPLSTKSLEATDVEEQSLMIYGLLEGNRAQEAVEEINTNLRQKGGNPAPRADGVYAFTLGDARYRYTARDGAFIFALNREIDLPEVLRGTSPEIAPTTRLNASLTLPAVNGASAPAFSLKMDAKVVTFTITAPGADPLSALANYMATLQSNSRSAREASADYYDDYD